MPGSCRVNLTRRAEETFQASEGSDFAVPTLRKTVEDVKDRALEVGVYLPLGVYSKARDGVAEFDTSKVKRFYGTLVERGQERLGPVESAARRRRRQVSEEATRRTQGIEREARRRRRQVEETVGRTSDEVRRTARRATGSAQDRLDDTRQKARKGGSRAHASMDVIAPKMPRVATPKKAGELPIDNYEDLTAGEIVSAAKGLTQTELAKVYKFERANQDRATVLEGIETKFVNLPIPSYDALSADEIIGRLEGLSDSELKTIRRYEAGTKARTTILEKVDSQLGATV